ncbi:MAG TPA: DUF3048 domain-containing protein [Candidatus Saccharimonadales bacterium]
MLNETQKPRFFARIRNWIVTHKKASIAIGVVLLLLIAGGITYAILSQKPPESKPVAIIPSQPKPKPIIYYSPLTGDKVADEAATKQAVTAIMIENSPSARPQSGLKDAGIVYEAIAEGGITRFLALYQQQKPDLIGPVRSLRMYYVDWLAPYNASVAHIGGSAAALAEVRNGNYRDIDQFFNAATYWRASDRYAPHNVYTNFERLDALNQAKGFTESTFTGFPRVDGKPSEAPTATSIAMNFSGPTYNTAYTYDKATNTYLRSLGGAPHMDREKGQITPSVVIALNVDEISVLEDGYRESIQTTGSGKATIFQNGVAQEVTWHKPSRQAQITFTDAEGKDVPLVRGQTWIGAIPNGKGSVSWQ